MVRNRLTTSSEHSYYKVSYTSSKPSWYPAPALYERSLTVVSSYSSMTDVVGNRSQFNGCDHYRSTASVVTGRNNITYSCNEVPPNTHFMSVSHDMPSHIAYAAQPKYTVNVPGDPGADWGAIVANLGASVTGDLRASAGIAEALGELGQTVRMVRRPLAALQSLLQKMPKLRKLPASELMKASSGVWLEYRYGWNPLLMTIRELSRHNRRIEEHLRYLETTRGRHVSIGHHQVYEYGDPLNESWRGYYSTVNHACPVGTAIKEYFSSVAIYAASADVYRDSTLGHVSKLRYRLQDLGLTNTFEALWELTPFSFVVDWLIHPTLLESCAAAALLRGPNVRNCGFSVKRIRKFRTLCALGRGAVSAHFPVTKVTEQVGDNIGFGSEAFESSYTRTPGLPNYLDFATMLPGANIIHAVDATALFAQIARRF